MFKVATWTLHLALLKYQPLGNCKNIVGGGGVTWAEKRTADWNTGAIYLQIWSA